MLRSPERWMAAFCVLLMFSGCTSERPPSPTADPERVSIAVTSYPLLAMAEGMAGSAADVEMVIEEGTSSPEWKPTSEAIQTMQKATRILISGGDYEPWLQRVTVPRSRLVDTAEGYYGQFVRIPDAVVHQHGPDGSHSHPGVVWATWLDPQLALSQLERTRDVLLPLLPDHVAEIQKAADRLADEFRQLDERLDQLAESTSDAEITVLGDAPVYQYLAQRLGWKLTYVHLPGHGPLTEEQRSSLTTAMDEQQPSMVWLQQTLAEEVVLTEGDRDRPVAVIDLCQSANPARSLTERLEGNLDRIEAVLQSLSSSDAP